MKKTYMQRKMARALQMSQATPRPNNVRPCCRLQNQSVRPRKAARIFSQPPNNLLLSLLIVTTEKCIFHSISKHHLLYKLEKSPQISFMRQEFILLWLMESHFQQSLCFSCSCPFSVVWQWKWLTLVSKCLIFSRQVEISGLERVWYGKIYGWNCFLNVVMLNL